MNKEQGNCTDTSDKIQTSCRPQKYLRVAVRSGIISALMCFEKDARDSFFKWVDEGRANEEI